MDYVPYALVPNTKHASNNIHQLNLKPAADSKVAFNINHSRIMPGSGLVDPKEYTLTCASLAPAARDDWITKMCVMMKPYPTGI